MGQCHHHSPGDHQCGEFVWPPPAPRNRPLSGPCPYELCRGSVSSLCSESVNLENAVRERGGRGDSREGKELRTIDVVTHLVTEHSAVTSVPSVSSVLSAFSNVDFRVNG